MDRNGAVSSAADSAYAERIVYGADTVTEIYSLTNVRLRPGSIIKQAHAQENIVAKGTYAEALQAGNNITITDSSIIGQVNAGGSITATQCITLGMLQAGSSVELRECPKVIAIRTEGRVLMYRSTVEQDVSAGSDVMIEASKIHGRLTCISNYLILRNATVDTVILCECCTVLPGSMMTRDHLRNQSIEEYEHKRRRQTVELCDYSTVRHVIFEGGYGEVIVRPGTALLDSIIGGTIRQIRY